VGLARLLAGAYALTATRGGADVSAQNDIELDRAQPYAPLIDLFVLLGKLKSKIQHVVGERFVAEFMVRRALCVRRVHAAS
jgi:hypothetical protein